MISGISASPGIAFGKALLLNSNFYNNDIKKIKRSQIDNEIEKFYIGRKNSIEQIKNILKESKIKISNVEKEIFDSHVMIIEDIEFENKIIDSIKNKLITADNAVNIVMNQQINNIKKSSNIYLKERIIDIFDIKKRLISNILSTPLNFFKKVYEDSIIVSSNLTPSETIYLRLNKITGFITDLGNINSHTSIIARSLKIPAIVGIGDITKKVVNDDYLIVDAINNKIYINPAINLINKIKKIRRKYIFDNKKILKSYNNLPATTLDGHKIKFYANINTFNDFIDAKNNGADGIGLYRTEFLFMDRNSLPEEEEQFEIYKKIAELKYYKEVIIRTIDIGGDKRLSYINMPKEDNPFLGWRATRVYFSHKNILHTQLRAILRASIFGKLKIMYPMISTIEEIRALQKDLILIMSQLENEGIKFDKKIEVGIMVETPSAAIIASHLIQEVDFFSIGTNDLTQYTLAVDRGNKLVSYLYDALSPSILKLIKNVIDTSHRFNKWTSLCGELSNNLKAALLIIGMGIDKISMDSKFIPKIKKTIRKYNIFDLKELSDQALSLSTKDEIRKLLKEFFK